ncbi:hypothetical protein Agabi119p4_6114 [Agaricus bisporus var. burnettii]|uniref:Uncharacterized protein n=1 Tax=Agaricus bisporus var. burnettii TaxID=192524 RepID=A0A8H7F1B9_AGABI|nr:hypothetical protein Agabi119p4_6114 [Agaricus bisporus var. burnettii]
MAITRTQTTQPGQGTQLCDLCRLKPKFGNHQHCSKTCASKAAALCNHCHKKPKFQNFDYCGKHCASLAAANGAKPKAGGPAINNATKKNGATNANQQLAGVSGTTIDPMQIAQLVVQHVPQIQSMIAAAQNPGSTTSGASTSAQPNESSITSNGTDQTTSSATKPNAPNRLPMILGVLSLAASSIAKRLSLLDSFPLVLCVLFFLKVIQTTFVQWPVVTRL